MSTEAAGLSNSAPARPTIARLKSRADPSLHSPSKVHVRVASTFYDQPSMETSR